MSDSKFYRGDIVRNNSKYEEPIGIVVGYVANRIVKVQQLNGSSFNWPVKCLRKDLIGSYLYG